VVIKFLNLWLNLLLICPLLFLSGCASVKITGASENSRLKPEIGKPSQVSIAPYFTIPKHENSKLNTKYLDQETGFIYLGRKLDNPPKPSDLGLVLTESLAKTMGKETTLDILITEKHPTKGIWVRGQMIEEKSGSRALRTIIGLGAGKTKLETKTHIYNLDKSKKIPWLTLWTSGHSGHEPGAVFSAMPSPIPIFNLIGATSTIGTIVNHSHKGLTQDAKRSGRVLGHKLSKEFTK
jgi:hypothetical protein